MVIEMLRVQCPPNRRAEFLQRDAAVWTQALSRHEGFISKESWLSQDDPDKVTLVIRWRSLAHWQSFPAELGKELDKQMGDLLCPLTCEAYEVHE
jgi:uncharacterized protein (TIGR03792 family)